MGLVLEFGLNLLVAGLLGVTIFYCWLLNKRIQILQDSRSELAELLQHFDRSTQKASDSILALQAASRKISETVQSRVDKANEVIDDLTFMLERADRAADQMEAGIAIARQKEKMAQEMAQEKTWEKAEENEPDTRQDTKKETVYELEEEVVDVRAERYSEPSMTSEPVRSARTLSSLQALIERVAERTSDPALRGNQHISGGGVPSRGRSQSEKELIEALRAKV